MYIWYLGSLFIYMDIYIYIYACHHIEVSLHQEVGFAQFCRIVPSYNIKKAWFTLTYIHIYTYIYVCECVSVCCVYLCVCLCSLVNWPAKKGSARILSSTGNTFLVYIILLKLFSLFRIDPNQNQLKIIS